MTTFAQWSAAVNPEFDIEAQFATAFASSDPYAVENFVAILIAGSNIYEYGAGATAENPAKVANAWGMNDKNLVTMTVKGKFLSHVFLKNAATEDEESYSAPIFGTP
jgi:hypothetical protein